MAHVGKHGRHAGQEGRRVRAWRPQGPEGLIPLCVSEPSSPVDAQRTVSSISPQTERKLEETAAASELKLHSSECLLAGAALRSSRGHPGIPSPAWCAPDLDGGREGGWRQAGRADALSRYFLFWKEKQLTGESRAARRGVRMAPQCPIRARAPAGEQEPVGKVSVRQLLHVREKDCLPRYRERVLVSAPGEGEAGRGRRPATLAVSCGRKFPASRGARASLTARRRLYVAAKLALQMSREPGPEGAWAQLASVEAQKTGRLRMQPGVSAEGAAGTTEANKTGGRPAPHLQPPWRRGKCAASVCS